MPLVDDFKNALSRWASGVAVVVTEEDGELYGITVSSFTSVSLDPPLVLVCLNRDNRLWSMIARCGVFSISMLAADQQEASNYFASPGREPTRGFTGGIAGQRTEVGPPIVDGCAAWLSCELHETLSGGTHAIVIGRVVHAEAREAAPLLYWNRAYRSVGE
jgi:3-hydroxy-9,10-secoandrosta-1,3,5(10)-triene-9,17-dione monooxygenase reductase component